MSSEPKESKKNPLLFPFIACALAAMMYFFAFHSERDKVKDLEERIRILENTM